MKQVREKVWKIIAKKWTRKEILALTEPGKYRIETCLYLSVSNPGTKSWVFRWRDRVTGKLRDHGFGSYGLKEGQVSLAKARQKAPRFRAEVKGGKALISESKATRMALKAKTGNIPSFKEACERYIKPKAVPECKNPMHVQQWENTLKTYAEPIMRDLRVSEITDMHVVSVAPWTRRRVDFAA